MNEIHCIATSAAATQRNDATRQLRIEGRQEAFLVTTTKGRQISDLLKDYAMTLLKEMESEAANDGHAIAMAGLEQEENDVKRELANVVSSADREAAEATAHALSRQLASQNDLMKQEVDRLKKENRTLTGRLRDAESLINAGGGEGKGGEGGEGGGAEGVLGLGGGEGAGGVAAGVLGGIPVADFEELQRDLEMARHELEEARSEAAKAKMDMEVMAKAAMGEIDTLEGELTRVEAEKAQLQARLGGGQ